MLMPHDPARPLDVTDYPMSSMKEVMDLHIDLMKNFKQSKFVGINLLTVAFSKDKALSEIKQVENQYGIATTDLIRFGDGELINALEDLI